MSLAFAVVITCPCSAQSDGKLAPNELVEAMNLSSEKGKQLESHLKSNPKDMHSRMKLVVYYYHQKRDMPKYQKAYWRHVLWIVKNRPLSEFITSPHVSLDPDDATDTYKRASALWKKHIESQPDNPDIYGNAADFFSGEDDERAARYLRKAMELEPESPRWPKRLGKLFQSRYRFGDGSKEQMQEWAQKSHQYFHMAEKRHDGQSLPIDLLKKLGKTALASGQTDRARTYARRYHKRALNRKNNSWKPHQDPLHFSYLLLGRVALKEGEVEQACTYLMKAADVSPSPSLQSFGPGMSLAYELLKNGENDTVIEYLDEVNTYWKEHDRIERWKEQIRRGEMPKFGYNRWK